MSRMQRLQGLPALDPGTMTERITLERPVRITDSRGRETITWVPVGTYWAQVGTPFSWETNQLEVYISHAIRMRRVAAVRHDWRAIWHDLHSEADRTLNFRSVIAPDPRQDELRIMAEEAETR